MKTDVRLQVYLHARDYKTIKERARAEGISVAELMRRAARKYLKADPETALMEGHAALQQGTGVCRDRGGDVSTKHDKYLGGASW